MRLFTGILLVFVFFASISDWAQAQSSDVMQIFQTDISPSPAVVNNPTGAVLERMPALKGLYTRMALMPSLGILTIFSAPSEASKIKMVVNNYMDRPKLDFGKISVGQWYNILWTSSGLRR
jgi:hypothetical protein